jgi:uncharacterized membrane protein
MESLKRNICDLRVFIQARLPWRVLLVMGVMVLMLAWTLYTPDGFLGKADAVGYAVCHRIEHRSYHIGDYQLSMCARCSGQYLGAVLGVAFLATFRRFRAGWPPRYVIFFLLIWVSGYAIDGVNSFLHLIPGTDQFRLYEPSNTLRLITGIGVGLGISVLLVPAFNQTVWKRYDPRPILQGLRDFGILLVLAILLILLVITESPVILYPLSLISAGGVLILLTMVYSMIWVMIFRLENCFENFRNVIYLLLAGFAVALSQIFVLDFLRFVFSGTWGEFPLP